MNRKATTTRTVKFNGKEVHNPLGRVLVLVALFVISSVVLVFLLALSPVLILTHYVLRACGRHGFVYRTREGNTVSFSITIDNNGFKRAR